MARDDTHDDEKRLDHALKSLFADGPLAEDGEDPTFQGEERGSSHIALDRLAALRDGSLGADEQDAVRAHVVDCRQCAELWRDLVSLAPDAEPAADFGRAVAWRELQSRLQPEKAEMSSRSWTWAQLAAAVLLVTSLVLAFQVRQLRQTSSELQARMTVLESPRENVPVLYLDALRSTVDDAAIPDGPADEIVVLMISPSIREAFPSYELVIEDEQGRTVWSGQGFEQNAYGTIRMAARRSFFSKGASTVRVFGVRDGVREPAGVYPLRSADP